MPTASPSNQWIVEQCCNALNRAFQLGLTEALIATLTTVASLDAALAALVVAEQDKPDIAAIRKALTPAAGPVFPVSMAGITVTPTPSNAGGSLATATYFFKVTAIDRLGRESEASAEVSGAVTTGASGSVALAWAAQTGAISYRVYYGTATGVYTGYKTTATNSYTLTITTGGTAGNPPIAGRGKGGYGFLTDAIVAAAAGAANGSRQTTLIYAIADQHPNGTAWRGRVASTIQV